MIKQGIRRIPIKDKDRIVGVVTDTDILRVEPGLIDVLVERLKYDVPGLKNGGVCEECNSYARRLIRVNGMLVCQKCKKKI
jgi:signal-transduction protein with cAMP-binding, CBS, and nucleotidyltransferase domain